MPTLGPSDSRNEYRHCAPGATSRRPGVPSVSIHVILHPERDSVHRPLTALAEAPRAVPFGGVDHDQNRPRFAGGSVIEQRLIIEFAGEVHCLEPAETLEFGRRADLVVDDNKYLHRRMGRFEQRSGLWMLRNIGRSLHLTIRDTKSHSLSVVAPGREIALTFAPATIRFRAGPTTYEMTVDGIGGLEDGAFVSDETLDTVTFSDFPLTPSQRLVIVALAEQSLADPSSEIHVPNSGQIAAKLGWTASSTGGCK